MMRWRKKTLPLLMKPPSKKLPVMEEAKDRKMLLLQLCVYHSRCRVQNNSSIHCGMKTFAAYCAHSGLHDSK